MKPCLKVHNIWTFNNKLLSLLNLYRGQEMALIIVKLLLLGKSCIKSVHEFYVSEDYPENLFL